MNPNFSRAVTPKELFLLQIFVCFIWLGRAYQGLFFDLPLRAFFWNQNLLENLVIELTNDSWQSYVTNQSIPIDSIINILGTSIGFVWLLAAFSTFFISEKTKGLRIFYYFSIFLFAIILLLDWQDKFQAWGHLLEHATQFSSPLLLLYFTQKPSNTHKIRLLMKAIISLTFVCHGLYAVGYYPTSGEWISWTMRTLYLEDSQTAVTFLFIAGMLDFLMAFLLFFDLTSNLALYYCIFWGLLTALVRIIANFYIEIPLISLHDWTYQTFFRLIHGGFPLLLLSFYKKN